MQRTVARPDTGVTANPQPVASPPTSTASRTIPFTAPAPVFDPVALTVLAVNRLAPATLRTSSYGKALKLVVPDTRIGEVFRAALEQMRMTRTTDRLIEIVVDRGVSIDASVTTLAKRGAAS